MRQAKTNIKTKGILIDTVVYGFPTLIAAVLLIFTAWKQMDSANRKPAVLGNESERHPASHSKMGPATDPFTH